MTSHESFAMHPRTLPVHALLIALMTLGMPATLAAQSNTPQGINPQVQVWPDTYGPGTLDMQLTLGFGALFSPQIEPAVDLGLIPLGEDLTLSVGASVAAGYCLGCVFLSALTSIKVRYWSLEPLARVLLHVESLSRSLNVPQLDLYGGLIGGPSIYTFTITETSDTISVTDRSVAVGLGALGGMHYLLNDRVYLGAELRYLLYLGVNTGSVTIDGTTYDEYDRGDYIQSGLDYTFHLGVRF